MRKQLQNLSPEKLAELLTKSKHTIVITGAGVSVESGLPTYRGKNGIYNRANAKKPLSHSEFINSELNRKRFWLRGIFGYKTQSDIKPNRTHLNLKVLEDKRLVKGVITQNVDRLHHVAGSKNVLELHGRGDRCACTNCGREIEREAFQEQLREMNKELIGKIISDLSREKEQQQPTKEDRPDFDFDLGDEFDYSKFVIKNCEECKIGTIKPQYVFFGGTVPKAVADEATAWSSNCDCLVVVGSTCSTFSCFRLIDLASKNKALLSLVNVGETRIDSMVDFKNDTIACGDFFDKVVHLLK